MALIKGSNSYVSVAEADTYFSLRLDVAAWLAAEEEQKAQALVTATQILDSLDWVGIAISATQPLAFPRSGMYFDNKIGNYILLPEGVPDRVLIATNELAYHLLNNDGVLDDVGSLTSLSVGQINLLIKHSPSTVPNQVKRYIRPLLDKHQNMWWRAN
jgi:hypothetical protein